MESIVGGENEQRVVPLTFFFQSFYYPLCHIIERIKRCHAVIPCCLQKAFYLLWHFAVKRQAVPALPFVLLPLDFLPVISQPRGFIQGHFALGFCCHFAIIIKIVWRLRHRFI